MTLEEAYNNFALLHEIASETLYLAGHQGLQSKEAIAWGNLQKQILQIINEQKAKVPK